MNSCYFIGRVTAFCGLLFTLFAGVVAAEPHTQPSREAVIQYADRRFEPTKIEVPAGEPLLIRIVNRSNERIEFESFKLHREKVVAPGETLVLRLQPLKAGRYDFFDDFHETVPEGEIVATATNH